MNPGLENMIKKGTPILISKCNNLLVPKYLSEPTPNSNEYNSILDWANSLLIPFKEAPFNFEYFNKKSRGNIWHLALDLDTSIFKNKGRIPTDNLLEFYEVFKKIHYAAERDAHTHRRVEKKERNSIVLYSPRFVEVKPKSQDEDKDPNEGELILKIGSKLIKLEIDLYLAK